jgi:tetratricopeptide (TPR) repeat protein
MAHLSFFHRKIAVTAVDRTVESTKQSAKTDNKGEKGLFRSHSIKTESTLSYSDRDFDIGDTPLCFSDDEEINAENLTHSPQLKGMEHIMDEQESTMETIVLSSLNSEDADSDIHFEESKSFQSIRPPKSPSQGTQSTRSIPLTRGPNSPVMEAGFLPSSPLPPKSPSPRPRRNAESCPGKLNLKKTTLTQVYYEQSLNENRVRQRSYSLDEIAKYSRTTSSIEKKKTSPSSRGSHRRVKSSIQNVDLNDLESLKRSIKRLREKYGDVDYRVGQVWNHIGNFFFRQQDYPRALDAYKGAVMCHEGNNVHIGAAYGNIGTVYWTTGDLTNAVTFLNKALEMHRYVESVHGLDPDSSCEVSNSLYQIGLALSLQKDYETAMGTLKYCRRLREKTLGSMHMDLARTIDAIGKIHLLLGELDDAMDCHQQALSMKCGLVRNSDSAVITSLMNIAAVHQARELYDDAIFAYLAVLSVQKQNFVECKDQAIAPRFARETGETLQVLSQLHRQNGDPQSSFISAQESRVYYNEAGMSIDDPKIAMLNSILSYE